MRVFTIGYQGISLPDYVEILSSHGIGIVLDVRETPWSRKPGFSKSQLSRALEGAGIQYQHVRSAGNPSENRKTAESVKDCLQKYRKHLRRHFGCLDELLDLIKVAEASGRPACLTCFEKMPEECHRSILVEALRKVEPRLHSTDLS